MISLMFWQTSFPNKGRCWRSPEGSSEHAVFTAEYRAEYRAKYLSDQFCQLTE